jgi:hypothetical protein
MPTLTIATLLVTTFLLDLPFGEHGHSTSTPWPLRSLYYGHFRTGHLAITSFSAQLKRSLCRSHQSGSADWISVS